MRFFLGCPDQSWFGLTPIPMFVSRRVLARRRSFYRARGPYAIDSGAFTEIQKRRFYAVQKYDPRGHSGGALRLRSALVLAAFSWRCRGVRVASRCRVRAAPKC